MTTTETTKRKRNIGWLKKIGMVGFLFFLIKGIGWLVIIGLLAFGVADESTVQKIKDWMPF